MVWSFTPRLDYGVYLDGSEADFGGALDGMEDAASAEAAPVHLLENFVVNAVEAYGDAMQAGVLQPLGLLGQQVAISRESDVGDAFDGSNLGYKLRQVGAQQWLAAGDAGLWRPRTRRTGRSAG